MKIAKQSQFGKEPQMERRQFLKSSALAGAVLAISNKRIWATSADSRIEIFLDEPRGEISPNLYGQFTEHIGGVIYDGVWVGEQSKIRNEFGIRAELIDRMKEIQVSIVRWPGGEPVFSQPNRLRTR